MPKKLTKHRILRHDFICHNVIKCLLQGGLLMNWIQYLSKAISYIEAHLTDDINIDEVANQSYVSIIH